MPDGVSGASAGDHASASMRAVHNYEDSVAIIGMSGRFPDATSVDAYWTNLSRGVESTRSFNDEELRKAGIPEALLRHPKYVKAGAPLSDIEYFDAAFFGYTPRQAEAMDPGQRVFLECAWTALEDAGYAPDSCDGRIGVYAGSGMQLYLPTRGRNFNTLVRSMGAYAAALENDKDHLTTRVAYKLNLKGPAVTVQTACSTSLVAVHIACQSLMNGECEIALAGGATVRVPQRLGYFFQEGGIMSPDGHCRAFDSEAKGTVPGNGVGVVVLKPMAKALEDGDHVYAVIRGTAVNNDGATKLGYAAPSIDGQTGAIVEAQEMADVDPASIGYVEAHGTGTPFGDPVEFQALTQAFRLKTQLKGFCALGSVKTNVGHLDAAAGVAGLIKATLSLHHEAIPPTLHFRQPNPKLDLDNSPFYINADLKAWPRAERPRRAGVSSFGIGGTNAHVILEEAPERAPSADLGVHTLLVLSAKTPEALDDASANIAGYLKTAANANLADVAYTLYVGRSRFSYRRAVVCRSQDEAVAALEALDRNGVTEIPNTSTRSVAMLCSGRLSGAPTIFRALYGKNLTYTQLVDACIEGAPIDLRSGLSEFVSSGQESGEPNEPPASDDAQTDEDSRIQRSAVIVAEYCLGRLWLEWGVHPSVIGGNGLGELTAACLAGVLSIEDALRLVSESDLKADLSSANGSSRKKKSSESRVSSHKAGADEVADCLDVVDPVSEDTTVLTGSGRHLIVAEAADPSYWMRTIHASANFSDLLEGVFREPVDILVEIGGGDDLRDVIDKCPSKQPDASLVHSLPAARDSSDPYAHLLRSFSHLWLAGARLDGSGPFTDQERLRLPLPSYPFRKERHWIESQLGVDNVQGEVESGGPAPEPVDSPRAVSARHGRRDRIVTELKDLVAGKLGLKAAKIDADKQFVRLGLDSLIVMQFSEEIRKAFGIEIPFRRLMEEFRTINEIAAHLDTVMPSDASRQGNGKEQARVRNPATAIADAQMSNDKAKAIIDAPSDVVSAAHLADLDKKHPDLKRVFAEQLRLMSAQAAKQHEVISRQLDLLEGKGEAKHPAVVPAANDSESGAGRGQMSARSGAAIGVYGEDESDIGAGGHLFGSKRQDSDAGTARYVETLVSRLSTRTAGSKKASGKQRPYHADSRASMGFRMDWKELVYPIVVDRAKGARIWDVDGNEYVDLAMGFGVHLFGHNPEFIVDALVAQLNRGVQLGPQSPLAGEVADLVTRLSGLDRVAFTSSGSEAVMSAVRLARTITRKDKIAVFAGSYHGSSDQVLVRPVGIGNGSFEAVPLAPGIPARSVENTMVLKYGDASALEAIANTASELAAVLVEPVQARRPDFQPIEFLKELRALTETQGTVLVFDEIITGFRMHQRGAQAAFGVDADLVTYGKVVGGGMPIGVIAGATRILDAVDGGAWRYGDDSYPPSIHTFQAGTFYKHPLTMAASRAVLTHLEVEGPELQQNLNEKASDIRARLNALFSAEGMPLRVVGSGSLFRFTYPPQFKAGELFFYHLLLHGVYVWEGRTCFLSTAHTAEDIDHVVQAVARTVTEMRSLGVVDLEHARVGNGSGAARPLTRASVLSSPEEADAGRPVEFPLTETQSRIWLSCQEGDDASCAYNEVIAFELKGTLDVDAMQQALQALVSRHEALRTAIDQDGFRQLVLQDVSCELTVVNLADPAGLGPTSVAQEWLRRESKRAFDLTRAPLLRPFLVEVDSRRFFVLIAHHLVMDSWSLGILLREWSMLYSGYRKGAPPRFSVAKPFRQYAQDRLRLGEKSKDRARSYWLTEFADPPMALHLPGDRPRPRVKTFSGARESMTLDSSDYERITEFCEALGCTQFVALFSAFGLLVQRLSRQDDFVIGVALSGRSGGADHAGVVGCCLNPSPLRIRYDSGETVEAYVSRIGMQVLDVNEHQAMSLSELIRELDIPRDPSRTPLVEANFNVDRIRARSVFDCDVEAFDHPITHSKYDLMLNITDLQERLFVVCDYSAELFDADTIGRWLQYYRVVLLAMCEGRKTRVGYLNVLPDYERDEAIAAAAPRHGPAPQDVVHAMFERQVAKTPDAVAIRLETRSLTFAALDRRANQLARCLTDDYGVGRGSVIGVCMDRSTELVVGVLATLKAGAAFVPMDPEHPADRLKIIVDSARIGTVLLNESSSGCVAFEGIDSICVASDWSRKVAKKSAGPLDVQCTPRDLAYVMYTSGSSGRPKGCEIEHAQLAHYLSCAMEYYADEDVGGSFALCTSIASDLTLTSVFVPLVRGKTLHLCSSSERDIAACLEEIVDVPSIDSVKLTPSHVVALEEMSVSWPHLELVILGGEEVRSTHLQTLRRANPALRIINEYGPTEATVGCVACELSDDIGPIPIGTPMGHARAFVCDRSMNIVPSGVTGELVIGGASVGRGYRGEARLTAERFIPDPFSPEPGSVLYLTGDLVRVSHGGNLEFLGREDRQVKIRGFRVELGEVESRLASHPGVEEVAVVDMSGPEQEAMLTAYIVPRSGSPVETGELRSYLSKTVLSAMVPAEFELRTRLPYTSSGKVDRRALATASRAAQAAQRDKVAPRNEIEVELANIWSELLPGRSIGAFDNYFDLGGDSLMAVRLLARVRAKFGVRIPFSTLLEQATVAELAAVIESSIEGMGPEAPIPSESGRESYPASFSQEGLWVVEQLNPGSSAYNLSVAAHLEGAIHLPALQESVDALAERQQSLRTVFRADGGTLTQTIGRDQENPIEIQDLTAASGSKLVATVEEACRANAERPFDLMQGPVFRVCFLRLPKDRNLVQIVVHHIVSDGWSLDILLRELVAFYSCRLRDESPTLPPLPIQYTDFALWQRRYFQGAVLDRLREHWRARLEGARVTEWPIDGARPKAFSFRGARETFTLDGALGRDVRAFARRSEVTLYMALLTAFKCLMVAVTGCRDLVLLADNAGRYRSEVEGLIGLFVNLIPLRTVLGDELTFGQALAAVRDTVTTADENAEIPFDRLVADLRVPRTLGGTPFSGIVFSLQTVSRLPWMSASQALRIIEPFTGAARFDLHIVFIPGADDSIDGIIDYNVDLYGPPSIQAMIRQYRFVVREMIDNPDLRIAELQTRLRSESVRSFESQMRALRDTARSKLASIRQSPIH